MACTKLCFFLEFLSNFDSLKEAEIEKTKYLADKI